MTGDADGDGLMVTHEKFEVKILSILFCNNLLLIHGDGDRDKDWWQQQGLTNSIILMVGFKGTCMYL